jgi:hypothetical protein
LSDHRWTVLCGIGAALLAIALSWDFLVLSLDPWPDQALILLAAERHHRGLGLTTAVDGGSDDLSVTGYRRLTYFPPGYPLIVSALRATGLSIATIVKIINGVALVAGFLGWMLLAGRNLSSRTARLLFALVLVLACRGTIPKGGTTDYVFWAVLPFWILAIIAGVRQRSVRWLLVAAALVSLLIGFRWAAVILIPAGVALALLDWTGSIRGRVAAAAAYGALPTLTFGGISLVNRMLSGHESSILSYVKAGRHFELLASYYPLEGAFSRPLALEPLLSRIWRAVDPPMSRTLLELSFRLLIPLVLLALVLFMADVRVMIAGSQRLFSHTAALTYACLVGLLASMTVRYNWEHVAWSYLEEPRYYLPFYPALALFWLAAGEKIRTRAGRWIAFGLLTVAVGYLGQAEARWSVKRLRAGEADSELLSQLSTIASRTEPRSVVFDLDVSRYQLWDSPSFAPRLYPDEGSTARLRATTPVDVWIVDRIGVTTAYVTDPQFDRKRRDALLRRFHPQASWTSSDGRFRVYHAPAGSF